MTVPIQAQAATTTTPAPPPPTVDTSNASCYDPSLNEYQVQQGILFMDVIVLTLIIPSAILQVYVIRSALHHINRKTGEQCLHIFLLSMTFSDLILTTCIYPSEILTRNDMVMLPRFFNIALHWLLWVGLSASSLSLVLLNIDKLIYFKFPLRYSTWCTRGRTIPLTCGIWVLCFSYVSFAWLTDAFMCRSNIDGVDDNCTRFSMFPGKVGVYVIFSVCVCVVPTVTSLSVAVYIMQVVSTHRRQLAEEQALMQGIGGSGGRSASQAVAGRLRTFYYVFMTTLWTAFTLLPARFFNIWRVIQHDQQLTCSQILFNFIFVNLVTLNSLLNPLITVTVLPQYRCSFFSSLRQRYRHRDSQDRTRTTTDLCTLSSTLAAPRSSHPTSAPTSQAANHRDSSAELSRQGS